MKKYAMGLVLTLISLSLASVSQAQGAKPVPYQEGLHYFLIDGAPVTTQGPMDCLLYTSDAADELT